MYVPTSYDFTKTLSQSFTSKVCTDNPANDIEIVNIFVSYKMMDEYKRGDNICIFKYIMGITYVG